MRRTLSAPFTFLDVLVLHQTDLGWLCEIEGQRVFVARLQLEAGTVTPAEGERGTIQIAGHAVDDIRRAIADRRSTI